MSNAGKAFQFVGHVGVVKSVVQLFVLKICEKRRIEVTRRSIQLQVKALSADEFVRQGAVKK